MISLGIKNCFVSLEKVAISMPNDFNAKVQNIISNLREKFLYLCFYFAKFKLFL